MQTGSALDVIKTNEQLVASLGVDVESGAVAEDRAAFEDASAALTEAAGSGLTVLPVYGEDANFYVAKAPDDPALRYYSDLGLTFVPVEGEDYYWEVLSWEQADKYQPDIVLYSVRDSFTPEQLMDQPVFAQPGGRAGRPAAPVEVQVHGLQVPDELPRGAGRLAGDRPEGDYLTSAAPGAVHHRALAEEAAASRGRSTGRRSRTSRGCPRRR